MAAGSTEVLLTNLAFRELGFEHLDSSFGLKEEAEFIRRIFSVSRRGQELWDS